MSDPSALAAHQLQRREHKYHLDRRHVVAIREALRPYCVPGPSSGGYTIDSIYLDSASHAFFRAYAQEHENRVSFGRATRPTASKAWTRRPFWS